MSAQHLITFFMFMEQMRSLLQFGTYLQFERRFSLIILRNPYSNHYQYKNYDYTINWNSSMYRTPNSCEPNKTTQQEMSKDASLPPIMH